MHSSEHKARRKVLRQQLTYKWSDCIGFPDHKHLVELLTPSCRDLLDHIFENNEINRISIEKIKQHPWFSRILPYHLESALEWLKKKQDSLNEFTDESLDDKICTLIDKAIDTKKYTLDKVKYFKNKYLRNGIYTFGKTERLNLSTNAIFLSEKTSSDDND